MLYLDVLCSNFEKLLSYLKSTRSDMCNCKISLKIKVPNFVIKNALFEYFGIGILKKTIVTFGIGTLKSVQS